MRAVNAVTTSWPGLHVDRPTFSAVAESELDSVHRYLLFLTGNRAVAQSFPKTYADRFTETAPAAGGGNDGRDGA